MAAWPSWAADMSGVHPSLSYMFQADLADVAVQDLTRAASPFAPLLEEPGKPAAELFPASPMLQMSADGLEPQHGSRGSPAHQDGAPLTSVDNVINGLRRQECHPIAGFTALHEAQNAKPLPGGLSVIDLAKRIIGQNASRSVRYTRLLMIAPASSPEHALPVQHPESANVWSNTFSISDQTHFRQQFGSNTFLEIALLTL